MACVRKRRGVWVCDYRDHLGIRRTPSFPTKEQADQELARAIGRAPGLVSLAVDAEITVAAYAARWLQQIRGTLKAATVAQYERSLRLYVVPAIGGSKVRKLRRGEIKALLADLFRRELARDTVRLAHATLRAMLNAARDDDELIRENPAEGLGRALRLVRPKDARGERVKAFDPAQLDLLLRTCRAEDAALFPLLLTLARTGMRPGEALALRWDDVDLGRREIRVERAVSHGRIETPKVGHGRTVKVSPALHAVLRGRSLQRAATEWVFPSEAGTRLDHHNMARRFRRIVRLAKLPQHHTVYCLRHTFASILLAAGVSPAYVQEQLGHASITLTVGTYGRWLRKQAPGADVALDGEPVTAAVANSGETVAGNSTDATQVAVGIGDPGRARTFNPEIKSVYEAVSRHVDVSLNGSGVTCLDFGEW